MRDDYNLTYRIRPSSPRDHMFSVEIELVRAVEGELILSMPAWIPGSYMIRDFARNLVSIEATAGAVRCGLEKLDKQTWHLTHCVGPITVRYQIYAWELTVRSAHLDTTHAYFNGPSVFLRVEGHDQVPCRVELEPPPGEAYGHWRVASSLQRAGAEPDGFGAYRAGGYEDLIDHPVEMGDFSLVPFSVSGVPHRMVITGRHRADEGRLQRDLVRICETHAAVFGALPVDRYLFLTTAVGNGYGGLEHGYSTSLMCSRDELPGVGMVKPTDGYRRFLGLCSHEYFHLWNVKRIRPQVFMDNGLEREVHTRLLWAFEGITSYYDDLALVRSGCIDESGYLELLAETITRVMRSPGRLVQTLAQSSFDAWTKFYKQDENATNAIVSYYAKGALVALALDLTIRFETKGAMSLDDVMRALWEHHGRTGVGVPERGVEALAKEVTGLDLDTFFDQALDSTEDLDLARLLSGMGVGLRMRSATGPKDLGGVVDEPRTEPVKPTLGLHLTSEGADPVIGVLVRGSPAAEAGLASGDCLIAVDGIRVTRDNLDALSSDVPAGAEVVVHAFRRDELMSFRARPRVAPEDTCELRILPQSEPEVERRRAAWLGQDV